MERTFTLAGEALDEARVRFVIAGGFAVNAHGYGRTTRDVDLLLAEQDRASAVSALERSGFLLRASGSVASRFDPPAGGVLAIDLLPLDGRTFDALWSAATERLFMGCPCRILALDHLVAMKLHAMRHDRTTRGLKDLLDIAELARAHRWSPGQAPLKDLIERYGTPEIAESIRKALGLP